jgi:mRNA interferase MazF
VIRRGDVCWVDFGEPVGTEASMHHPAVVVSNDQANEMAVALGRGVITVLPLTSSVERIRSFQVLLPAGTAGLPRDSKAQAEQVRAVDIARVDTNPVGSLEPALMARVDAALRTQLAL